MESYTPRSLVKGQGWRIIKGASEDAERSAAGLDPTRSLQDAERSLWPLYYAPSIRHNTLSAFPGISLNPLLASPAAPVQPPLLASPAAPVQPPVVFSSAAPVQPPLLPSSAAPVQPPLVFSPASPVTPPGVRARQEPSTSCTEAQPVPTQWAHPPSFPPPAWMQSEPPSSSTQAPSLQTGWSDQPSQLPPWTQAAPWGQAPWLSTLQELQEPSTSWGEQRRERKAADWEQPPQQQWPTEDAPEDCARDPERQGGKNSGKHSNRGDCPAPYWRARPGHKGGGRAGSRGSLDNPNVIWFSARAKAKGGGKEALADFLKHNPKPTEQDVQEWKAAKQAAKESSSDSARVGIHCL